VCRVTKSGKPDLVCRVTKSGKPDLVCRDWIAD